MERIGLTGQTVTHLREIFRAGQWVGKLPGIRVLARECGVSHDVMRAALVRLEATGEVTAGGNGRPRRIAEDRPAPHRRAVRVAILLDLPFDQLDANFQLAMLALRDTLDSSGHGCRFTAKSLRDLKLEIGRTARYVAREAADVWVVVGATREILLHHCGLFKLAGRGPRFTCRTGASGAPRRFRGLHQSRFDLRLASSPDRLPRRRRNAVCPHHRALDRRCGPRAGGAQTHPLQGGLRSR
jgi:hypothetical protein